VTLAAARGELTPRSTPVLRHGLVKLLADGVPVLLDVSALRMPWAPGPEVFVTAVAAGGGWPQARLVLFGAYPAAAERMRACRVTEWVPHAATVEGAAELVAVRPTRLARAADLPGEPASVQRARELVRDACRRWDVPDSGAAVAVATELATNALRHAGTGFRLRLLLDPSGLRISVRDGRPGGLPDGLPAGRGTWHRGGLALVAELSRWSGVMNYDDGKTVWAVLALSPARRGVPRGRATGGVRERSRPGQHPGAPTVRVTRPRRQRYATADPEQAHEFLRTVYGEHSPRLSGGADFTGFHLEYDGTTTNRFAVERVAHTVPFEGLFAPAEALVVAHVLDGDLRVASERAEQRAGADDVLLLDAAAATRVDWRWLDVETVRLDRRAVAQIAADVAGIDPTSVRFALSRPVSAARAAHWRAAVRHLRTEVLVNDEVMASPLSRAEVFRSLATTLVETFPNPALDALAEAAAGRFAPLTVRRAVTFIEDHAADDVGLADIAAAAGIGPRGLQLAFRRHHDMTPLEYLRRVRLEHAHRDLQSGNPATDTVAAIAARWGFTHHGNFSAAYLRAYGRSPSITLRS
jgi:AraC-like DNA-binding protein